MTNIVASTRERIRQYLGEIYGENYTSMVVELDDTFIIKRGSAAVHLTVMPMNEEECFVRAMAYVVKGARITPNLLTELMRLNAKYPVGAYGLLFDDTIVFSHTIVGAGLDKNELRMTVATVAFVADETDDKIINLAGGMTAVDANAAILDGSASSQSKAKKAPAKKAAAKAPAKKAAAMKPPVKKATVKKPAPAKKAVAKPKPMAKAKPAAKPKVKPVAKAKPAAKPKPAMKAKPVAKAKPAMKAKPAPKKKARS